MKMRTLIRSLSLIAVLAWVGGMPGSAATNADTVVACNQCSIQYSMSGLVQVGPYDTYAAALSAAQSGAALDFASRVKIAQHYVVCPHCSSDPSACIGHVYYSSPPVSWYVAQNIINHKYYVVLDIPDGAVCWLCCEPYCDVG